MSDEQADAGKPQSTEEKPKGEKGDSSSPTKVQDLTKAGREAFDPNEGQE